MGFMSRVRGAKGRRRRAAVRSRGCEPASEVEHTRVKFGRSTPRTVPPVGTLQTAVIARVSRWEARAVLK